MLATVRAVDWGRRSALTPRHVATLAMVALVIMSPSCAKEEKVKWPDRCPQAPGPGIEWARCQLRGADLSNANLEGALIHNVDLTEADLTGVNLSGASVANTKFTDAILHDADLTDTLITGGDIQMGKFCKTTMPDGKIASGDC